MPSACLTAGHRWSGSFLSGKPEAGAADAKNEPSPDAPYLIGGQKALFELRAACEAFLSQIDGEFFSSDTGEAVPARAAVPYARRTRTFAADRGCALTRF